MTDAKAPTPPSAAGLGKLQELVARITPFGQESVEAKNEVLKLLEGA